MTRRIQTFALAALTSLTALCITPAPASAQQLGNQLNNPSLPVFTPAPTTESMPPARTEVPNTDSCPNATFPPPPVDESEAVAPGSPTPSPLPVTYSGPCGVTAPDNYKVDESVLASSWLVADIDSGEVIAMKDPHGRYRPASIIKVLLALVTIDELPLDKKITVSEESAMQEGSAAGIGPGGVYTVNDLLHGLLMVSGNDCAHALAQALGGDEAALRKINDMAAKLGMKDTRAATYSGLDSAGMSSSAWDMGLAYRRAYGNDTFTKIIRTREYELPGWGQYEPYVMANDNKLLAEDPDGIGGKTGFTDDAGHTFVGALDRNGHRIMAILLDTTVDRGRAWEQGQKLIHEAYRMPKGTHVATLSTDTEKSVGADTNADGTTRSDRSRAAGESGTSWAGIWAVTECCCQPSPVR